MNNQSFLPKNFGEALKTARKRKRLTQKQLAEQIGVHYNTISAWELGSYLPDNRGLVLELARHLALDTEETRELLEASLTALSPYWSVPLPRNPFFAGREAILQILAARLGKQQTVEAYALQGLGGVGKTQVALEYAYRHAFRYAAIFWMNAESEKQIIASFLRIAETLKLPECNTPEQPRIVAAVQRWLASHNSWLLIWDNVDDLELLKCWLPPTHQGAILLTTRIQALGTLAQGLELVPMDLEEGGELLVRRSRIFAQQATEKVPLSRLATELPDEYATAIELVRELGGLPLALDQVGAYVEETGCSLADYLAQYRRQGTRLLMRRGEPGSGHPQSVTATFLLAYERVEQRYRLAADILRICALLEAENIPEEFFTEGAGHLGEEVVKLRDDPAQFDQAISVLRNLSFIQRQAQMRVLTLHRLVQAVLREEMNEQESICWINRILKVLHMLFPEVSAVTPDWPQVWERCERLLPHTLACLAVLPEQCAGPEAIEVMSRAADYLRERGQREQAEALYHQALRLGEQVVQADHPCLIGALSGLGRLSIVQGKYEQAEKFYQRALGIGERAPGSGHAVVGAALNGLATICLLQGKYEQAKLFYQRTLAIQETALGPGHPEIASILNNMAYMFLWQGELAQAEKLHQRALAILEQALGPDHPEVAFPLNSLGDLYTRQGKYEQAEALYQRTLTIRRRVFGADHYMAAAVQGDLGNLYARQGKYEQAEALLLNALPLLEEALGTNNATVGQMLDNLGNLYIQKGKYEQARPLLQRALPVLTMLGADNLELASPLNGLATIYTRQGNYQQAESYYQQALKIRERVLGNDHPETARTMYELALLYHLQNNQSAALTYARRSLTISTSLLGYAHPQTLAARDLCEQLSCHEDR